MGNNPPLSLTTALEKFRTAGWKLAHLRPEAQRQQLVREAEGLSQSLESLHQQELARADEVAALPTSEVVSRVASRLGASNLGPGAVGPASNNSRSPIQDSAGRGGMALLASAVSLPGFPVAGSRFHFRTPEARVEY